MEKEFISYEQALALKELGFNENCIAYYDDDKSLFGKYSTITGIRNSEIYNKEYYPKTCTTPLYQQAFRWFREKYNLKGYISPVEYLDNTDDTYHWCVYNECNSGYDQLTYEEAELECLKKLIEIVKEKK